MKAEEAFLELLSTDSAYMESINDDGPLYSRLAAAVLADAFTRTRNLSSVGPISTEMMEKLYRMANGISLRDHNTKLSPAQLSEHNRRMIIRLYANHESLLGPIEHSLGRTNILLSRILPLVLKGRQNPLDTFQNEKGINFTEVRSLFLGIYAWILSRGKDRKPSIFDLSLFSLTADPVRVWDNINKYAKSREELRLLQEQVGYGFKDVHDLRYVFSALRDYPFIRLSDKKVVVPVARNLALAFCDGIYDFLSAHSLAQKNGSQFDDIFGDIAEEYVSQRVERTLGKHSYVQLPPLGKDGLSPDGFIVNGECVIEIKGKRLPRGVITTGNLAASKHFMDGKRGHGIAQLLAEAKRSRNGGGRGFGRGSIDHEALCLVTPDGLPGIHLAPIRNHVLRLARSFLESKHPDLLSEFNQSNDMINWLSFEEFDYLCRASNESSQPMGRLLHRYRLELNNRPAFDPKSGRFAPNLRAWLLERYPHSQVDPWLRESMRSVMDECESQLFSGSKPEHP